MISFHDEVGEFDKKPGVFAVAREVPTRLFDQHRRLRAGLFNTHQRHEGLLALLFILAQRLAGFRFVTFHVQQIVRDLEGKADMS